MKKYLLIIFNLFAYIILIYPQNLHKVSEVDVPKTERLNINILNKISLPAAELSESFESTTFPPSGWTTAAFGGSGWSRQTVGTPLPNWGESAITSPSGGGNAVAYCTYSGDPSFNDQWLVTPLLQNIQTQDTLYFWMRNQIEDYSDTVYIYYSTDGTNFTQIGHVYYPELGDTNWGLWYIHLGQYITAGSNVYLAFRELLADNINNGGAISLDLVSISGTGTSGYPSSIQLSKTFSFGNPDQSSGYRLIGMPGNDNFSVSTIMSGNQKTEWNVFYDDGSDPINLTEFNGQATFNFSPGKGFWALSRNQVSVSRQVNTVSLVANNTFAIPLHTGWNIISNPFEKSVNFDDIRNSNGLAGNNIFYSFAGTFTPANIMNPYEGYYFLNPDGRASLSIPYPFGTNLQKKNDQPYFLSEKNLKLELKSDEFVSEIMVGIDEAASNNYDDKDYFAPPSSFEELRINLVNNNLSTSYKQLFIEHRPEVKDGQSFDVEIKNITGKKAKLNIIGIENFSEYQVYLVNERLKTFYNLKEKNEIEVPGNHKKNKFKLLIGTTEFLKSHIDDYTADVFALYQNYPNPFNPTTFIDYQIPQKQHVSIKVYDVIGNLVQTLVNETKEKGYYEVEFNGSSLSSGIYLYEFVSGSVRNIKKMTLIK